MITLKIGLVLEGGAFKGTYTAGVLDTLLYNNIIVDECIASSSGALFGLNYISKQFKRTFTLIKEYCRNYKEIGLFSYITSGNVINDKVYERMIDGYSLENYKKSHINFYVTVTNIITGDAEYIKITNPIKEINYIKASCSMPFLSKIVKVNNHKYLDGGIKDNIPLKRALEMEYDKIIVVLTENYKYKMKKEYTLLAKLVYYHYPNLVNTLNNMHITYNETQKLVKKLEGEGRIFVIKPSKTIKMNKITRNLKKIEKLYNLGVKDTVDNLNNLKKYLNS